MEASEKEMIVDRVAWGDVHKMVELVHATAKREGLGNDLAEGVARAAKKWGDPSIAMEVKGQAMSGYDPRGLKGMGVVFATSNRGACHLRGYSFTSEIGGIPYRTAALEWRGKGKVVKILQDIHAVSDSLDICKFATFSENMDNFAAQYAAVTGVPMDADRLLEIGERVSNLERYYNNLCGIGEGSDYIPERFVKEASASGSSTGQVCEIQEMLEEYYAERGWKNGVAPEEKLKALGII
jgi:aldehyde:ferredoxin oxidoreductase